MKVIFAIFALCLVAVNADNIDQPPVDYTIMVNDILNEMEQIAKDAAVALKHSAEDKAQDLLQQVEAVVDSIEARRVESEECCAAQHERVVAAVDTLHKDMDTCGAVAAKTSAEIMTDISAASHQLLYDGYDVLRTYQRCKNYTNTFLANICYARLTVKATLYANNARKSIDTIRQSISERIPAVFTDAYSCTRTAVYTLIEESGNIVADIDSCIIGAQ